MDGYQGIGVYDSGRLIAEGTPLSPITFTSTTGTSPQSWNRIYLRTSNNSFKWCEVKYSDWGIHIYGDPSSNNVFEHCNIHHNDQGLRIERGSAEITNCNLYNNRHNFVTINNPQIDITATRIYNGGRDGIYSSGGNLLNINWTVIEDNGIGGTSTRNGIYARTGDVIYLGKTLLPIWDGYNTIRNNYGSEIYALLGISGIQLRSNSVHDNDGYEIYNSSGNPYITSRYCWFGEYPPNATQFYGNVTNILPLSSEPTWEGATAPGISKPAVVLNPKEYIDNLKNLILEQTKTQKADSGLAELFMILRSDYLSDQYEERDNFYQVLSMLSSAYGDYSIGKHAMQYMIFWKLLAGESKTAIELSLKALNKLDNPDRMGVMYNLVNLYAYDNQFDESKLILDRYKEQYKDDTPGIEFLNETLADKEKMYAEEKALAKGTIHPQEETVSLIPDKFCLHRAYPNPFNPKTTISFDLPKEAPVEIVVYDLMGREIWKTAMTKYAAGTHSIVWNGTNHARQPVGTGIYLIRLNSPKYSTA